MVVVMVVTMRVTMTMGMKMGTMIDFGLFRMGMSQPARLNPKEYGKENQATKQSNHQVSGGFHQLMIMILSQSVSSNLTEPGKIYWVK